MIHNRDMIKVFLIHTLKHEEEPQYSSNIPSERDLREVIPVELVHPSCCTNYLSSAMGWLRRVYIRHSDLVCMLWCSPFCAVSAVTRCFGSCVWALSFIVISLNRLKRRLSSLFGQKTSSDELELSGLSFSCPPDTRRPPFPLT